MNEKHIKRQVGYAIEDGRLDVDDAKAMTVEEQEAWLEKNDTDYDPY